MAKLRDMDIPKVFGYELDRRTLTPVRQVVDTQRAGDYGADPMGDDMFRMVPSGDVVTYAERCRRLKERGVSCPTVSYLNHLSQGSCCCVLSVERNIAPGRAIISVWI